MGMLGLYSMHITDSLDGCLEGTIGKYGLSSKELEPWLTRTQTAVSRLQKDYENGKFPLLSIPNQKSDLKHAEAVLDKFSKGAKSLVFYGTGGSSLGGQTVAQIGGWYIPGEEMPDGAMRPRMRFYDNLDPRTISASLANFDLKQSRFVVVSKSGSTCEPLLQAVLTIEALEKAGLGDKISEHMLAISEPRARGKDNRLRDLLEPYGVTFLDHNPKIGGRYSCLTNVGMLPALARGLDATAFRRGAARVVKDFLSCKYADSFAPAVGAAIMMGLAEEKGIHSQVMMPYADRLGRFANWYVQLVAESLGKNERGILPIAAVGPVDQHSQLQFFMDGPRHHMVTIIHIATQGVGMNVRGDLARKVGLPMMADRPVGDFSASQPVATAEALMRAGRPVRLITLADLNEEVAGGLLMRFMLETIIAADMLGVDPYDQPAVEVGKKLALDKLVP